MQVIHDNDKITHAVLGKGEVIDFRASTSAQVLFLLSTGLYKFPRLAAVREIICNGWDSHIKTGIRDKPLSIRITDTGLMIVRDFGTGIAHDEIGPIYCTAGDSTKVESEDETGGFGLGSKAPFAYRDHFNVASYHDGTKTTYAMTMSDSQSMGKPTAKVLSRIPTEETGLEVQLQLKMEDVHSFRQLIRRVVYMGDINATLDGEQLQVCGMDEAGSDMSFIHRIDTDSSTRGMQIGIRYGAVVYPLEEQDDFAVNLRKLVKVFQSKFGDFGDSTIILRAPSNSVSMVPSREALLYNPRTVATVEGLIEMANEKLAEAVSVDHREFVGRIVERAVVNGMEPATMLIAHAQRTWPAPNERSATLNKMFHDHWMTDSYHTATDTAASDFTKLFDRDANGHTLEDFAKWYVCNNFFEALQKNSLIPFYRKKMQGIGKRFMHVRSNRAMYLYLQAANNHNNYVSRSNLLRKLFRMNVKRPYLKAMRGVLVSDVRDSLVLLPLSHMSRSCMEIDSTSTTMHSMTRSSSKKFVAGSSSRASGLKYMPAGLDTAVLGLDPLFTVAWKHSSFETIQYQSLILTATKKYSCVYLVQLERGKDDPVAVCKALNKAGFKYNDLTDMHSKYLDEKAEERREAARIRREEKAVLVATGQKIKAPRSKKNSIVCLSSCVIRPGHGRDFNSWLNVTSPTMINNPQFMVLRRASKDNISSLVSHMDPDLSSEIFTKFADKTGITNREDVYKRFIAGGSKDLLEHISQCAVAEANTPRLLKYRSEQLTLESCSTIGDFYLNRFYKSLFKLGEFRIKLGLTKLEGDDSFWLTFVDFIECRSYYTSTTFNRNFAEALKDKLIHPKGADLTALLKRLSSVKPMSDKLIAKLEDFKSFYSGDPAFAEFYAEFAYKLLKL